MNAHMQAGIAVRQLLARRSRYVTLILGIAVGVAALMLTLSLIGGLQESYSKRTLDVAPHLILTGESSPGEATDLLADVGGAVEVARGARRNSEHRLRNVMTIVRLIEGRRENGVMTASPYLSTNALASHGAVTTAIAIKGVIPSRFAELSSLSRYISSGSVPRLTASRNGILLGNHAAADLGVVTGDRVQLVSLSGHLFPVQVAGIYRFGSQTADRSAIVNLRLAQSLEGATPGEATGIGLKLAHPNQVNETAALLENMTGHRVDVWSEANDREATVLKYLQRYAHLLTALIMVICALGISNVMTTRVYTDRREVAIMKTIGVTDREVRSIYLFHGILLSCAGGLLGLIAGSVGIWLLGHLPSAWVEGILPVDSPTFMMSWDPTNLAVGAVGPCLAALVAASLTVRAAAGATPATILREDI